MLAEHYLITQIQMLSVAEYGSQCIIHCTAQSVCMCCECMIYINGISSNNHLTLLFARIPILTEVFKSKKSVLLYPSVDGMK